MGTREFLLLENKGILHTETKKINPIRNIRFLLMVSMSFLLLGTQGALLKGTLSFLVMKNKHFLLMVTEGVLTEGFVLLRNTGFLLLGIYRFSFLEEDMF